ncbi:MAG: cysteine--tRNA ligase [Patescibacteria group bacterium]
MRIYNTLSGEKDELERPKGALKLFVCGPTVYDYIHLGNALTYVSFDLFARYLKSQGFRVFFLENITDIDDKIIQKAEEEKKTPSAIADFYRREFLKDVKALGIDTVTRYASATDFIPEIVKQVNVLLKKGFSYKIEGDGYYFDISKFSDYGKLSKRTVAQAEDGVSRIDESVRKKNKGDFCVWKFYSEDPAEPYWETEIGRGRPGWHIEDTAITEKFFGPQYDIHGGGIDLKFPHHEAEIAQQEAASGKIPFVKIWMHGGLLNVEGKKMSKSLGNFITARDFLKKYPPQLFRWMVLNHHYRSPLNYTLELVEQAKQNIETIKTFLEKLVFVEKKSRASKISEVAKLTKKAQTEIDGALDDDFNTPVAIAAFFEFMGEIEKRIWNLSSSDAKLAVSFSLQNFENLGFSFSGSKIPLKIRLLTQKRELSRARKQFVQSDDLRKEIHRLGYILEDTPYGPFVRKEIK